MIGNGKRGKISTKNESMFLYYASITNINGLTMRVIEAKKFEERLLTLA